ncbi:MAG: hypothetical protein A2328_09735 [Bdellovibrionales bacterium RIFOXYB2_FULL_36_6]|nr:MAG: hypothetical protein A2328_09735 [Bdellovibrionales bacterium RIFOXYB2_FULL_36_6]
MKVDLIKVISKELIFKNPKDFMSNDILTQNLVTEELEILLKFFPHGIIALDFETTGLSPLVDKIIEISAIKVTPEGITTFNELINPQIDIPAITTNIHHITDLMVKDSKTLDRVLPSFIDFLSDLPLIAHNAQFDMGFLMYNTHHLKLEIPQCNVFCSCKLARKIFKESANHKLKTVADTLGIEIKNHHRALDDAYASLRIFAKGLLRKNHTVNLDDVLKDANVFHLKNFNNMEDMIIPEHLKALEEKVKNQNFIEIKYAGGSHGKNFRPVHALSLLPLPGGNVLYGKCLLSDIYKSFLLKKITEWRDASNEVLLPILKKTDG